MEAITALVQSLGLSFASGVSVYATAAFVGLAAHLGWVGPLPGALDFLASPWVFGPAGAVALVEALALLVPGLATAWEAVHTAIRPLAAAAIAVLATWGEPRVAVVAGILGGALGLATHATKLGMRATIDTSPEPVSNAAATVGELGVVAHLAPLIPGQAVTKAGWDAIQEGGDSVEGLGRRAAVAKRFHPQVSALAVEDGHDRAGQRRADDEVPLKVADLAAVRSG